MTVVVHLCQSCQACVPKTLCLLQVMLVTLMKGAAASLPKSLSQGFRSSNESGHSSVL